MTLRRNRFSFVLIVSLLVFFILPSVSLASAQEVDVVIKQFTAYDLKRPCFNNGTSSGFCSAAATCNISIVKPNGQFLINNSLMTNNIPNHNISLTQTQTGTTGFHSAAMACTDGGLSGTDTFNILVSPSGSDDNSVANLIMLSFAFLLSFGIIILGWNKQDPTLMLLGTIVLFFFGLFTLINGVGNYRNDLTLGTSSVILGIAGYLGFRSSMEMMNGW